MHPADIVAAIVKAGASQASIAKALGVSAGAVWNVIHSKSRSDAIADHIAQLAGRPRHCLWPAVYSAEHSTAGAPVKPHYRLRLDGTRALVSMRARAA